MADSGPESSDIVPRGEMLARLMDVITERRDNPPPKSYTSTLFSAGLPKIAAKLLEEANETVAAAGENGDDAHKHLVYEAGDLVYHLFVLLAHKRIALSELESELASRFGISGIDEKQARTRKGEATWESLRSPPSASAPPADQDPNTPKKA
jgi:phosphoribosyl-ATP pyrophosphohydrolase